MLATNPGAADDAALRLRARDRALEIGERLLEAPNDVARGLAGNAGDALAFCAMALATGEIRYEAAMHAALKRAATGDYPASIALFSGASGLRVAAEMATAVEPRYRSLVERCDAAVESNLPDEPAKPRTYGEFDIVEGWAGARLARALRGPREYDRTSALLDWLIEDSARWQCPHPADRSERPVRDLGLAHGIAGVLTAIVSTHEALGERTAANVRAAAELLASCAVERDGYWMWPHSLGRDPDARYLSAWCYGTPGVACALYATGSALGDGELAARALDAARGIARRDAADWLVEELGLCHGLMGNALCFASLASSAGCRELHAASLRLVCETLDRLDAGGGRVYTREYGDPHETMDYLKGAAGVALALLTFTGDMPAQWMRAHGLRPL